MDKHLSSCEEHLSLKPSILVCCFDLNRRFFVGCILWKLNKYFCNIAYPDSYFLFVTFCSFLSSCAYVYCLLLPLCFSFHLLISNIHKICSSKVNVDSSLLYALINGLFLIFFYITRENHFDCNEIAMLLC